MNKMGVLGCNGAQSPPKCIPWLPAPRTPDAQFRSIRISLVADAIFRPGLKGAGDVAGRAGAAGKAEGRELSRERAGSGRGQGAVYKRGAEHVTPLRQDSRRRAVPPSWTPAACSPSS